METEGRVGERLTRAQIDELAEFTAWQSKNNEWPSIERRVTIWEHREMVEFGGAATACPSGRIPHQEVIDLAGLIKDLDARLKALEGVLPFVNGVVAAHGKKLTAIETRNRFANAVIAGHGQRIAKLEEAQSADP